jgi:hypothetical protein
VRQARAILAEKDELMQELLTAQHIAAHGSTSHHSAAQRSTAQRSAAQRSTAASEQSIGLQRP